MKPRLVLTNFGYKKFMEASKPWPKADLYIDCRGLIDGAQVDHVAIANKPLLYSYKVQIEEALNTLPTRWPGEPERPFHVAFFCAHGMHRSMAAKKILYSTLDHGLFEMIEVK